MTASSIAPREARAVEPANGALHALPCRPTIACTADIVPAGAIEVEAGYISRRLGSRVAPHAVQQSSPVLLKLTLVRWLQLQLGGTATLSLTDKPRCSTSTTSPWARSFTP